MGEIAAGTEEDPMSEEDNLTVPWEDLFSQGIWAPLGCIQRSKTLDRWVSLRCLQTSQTASKTVGSLYDAF
ncbi:hypothetical protein Pyn_25150 [Prunus yedoensis var. nudiflora]|uniref:Uncharacterized protein n=1 Tax=Prunus yedoensis var. nudiflora TaxID=2094558 RepID=A0A314UT45_PRUYE|nr:hypothetical protein Pyn_25150 [Prunus yedoensis var. nudiflora]